MSSIRQEINLYTQEFRAFEQPLSSRFMWRGAIGVFVVLLIVEGLVALHWQATEKELVIQQQRQQDVATSLAKAKQNQPASNGEILQKEIADTRAKIAKREQLQTIIGGQQLGNFQGFSNYLQAIARQISQGMSLTQVRILQAGSYVELGGWTRQADAVPSYLSRLRTENSFAKVKFGVVELKRNAQNNFVQFSVAKVKAP